MELNSQKVRQLAPENDPLKIGMGWTVADLDKPQWDGRWPISISLRYWWKAPLVIPTQEVPI